MSSGLVEKVGKTGRSTYYRLRKKPDINCAWDEPGINPTKQTFTGAIKGPKEPRRI